MKSYKNIYILLLIFGLVGMFGCDFGKKSSDDSSETSSGSGKVDDEKRGRQDFGQYKV